MRERSGKARALWPAAVLLGAACVFCWPVFLGRVMLPADMCLLMLPWRALQDQFPGFHRVYNPMFDPIQQYLPWRIYAVESLRSGLLPLWNPYAFCGTPFLANLQSALLYPANLVFLLSGARHGFGVSAILHLTLGGLFTVGLLRTLGRARAAAVFGALVFMFNGFVVTWLEFPSLSLWTLMWLPGILLCYERALRTRGPLWPALCAGALGLQFLGGHLQISAYIGLAFGLYAALHVIAGPREPTGRGRALAVAVIAAAVGVALAAAQILPTLELAGHTGRVAREAGAAVRTSFPLTHLVLYLVPNFFGNPVHANYWGSFPAPETLNFFETACYVGILPLFLAVWSLRRPRRREVWFFGGLTALALLAALGSPLYLVLYHGVPGFEQLAGLARVLSLAAFGMAGLSAVGLDDLLRRREPTSPRAAGATAAVVALAVTGTLALFWPTVTDPEFTAQLPDFPSYLLRQVGYFALLAGASVVLVTLRARMRAGPWALTCLAVLTADLFGFGIWFNPFVSPRMAYPETEETRWLEQHARHSRVTSLASDGLDWMAHNSPMIFGLRDIHGSDSLRVRRSFEIVTGPKLEQATYPPPESGLMDSLSVEYLMTRRPVGEGWEPARVGEAPVYRNPDATPRARVVSKVLRADDQTARGALAQNAEGLRNTALVEPEAELPEWWRPSARPSQPIEVSSTRFERDDADVIALVTDTRADGMLILSDSYYPGWRASLDGEPATIHRANYAFRGVAVPAGRHRVEMRYEPASFRVGLFVSLVALALLVGGCGFYLVSERRARSAASSS